jgi:hypothetical protein
MKKIFGTPPPGTAPETEASFEHDAQLYSKYVGGAYPVPSLRHARTLVSGLHVEMKLWSATATSEKAIHSPSSWRINDAGHNAWMTVLRGATSPSMKRCSYDETDRGRLIGSLRSALRANDFSEDPFLMYDEWLLEILLKIREQAWLREGQTEPRRIINLEDKPKPLTRIGQVQELVNVYVKHEACWQAAGHWQKNPHPGQFAAHTEEYTIGETVWALHAPLDQGLLDALAQFALGRHLIDRGLLQQTDDGVLFRPHATVQTCWWYQLDCLQSYYAFQLILRQLAMLSWPAEWCSNHIRQCHALYGRLFGIKRGPYEGPDWWQVALNIPPDVLQTTLDQLATMEDREVMLKKIQKRKDRDAARDILTI